MAKIIFVIAPEDFRDEELFMTQEEVAKCGHEMCIASHKTGTCMGVHGGIAQSDLLVEDVDTTSFDGVVFVGGTGSRVFFDASACLDVGTGDEWARQNGCGNLHRAGHLSERGFAEEENATVFESEIAAIEAKGAVYSESGVTVDGNIITANGAIKQNSSGWKSASFWLAKVETRLLVRNWRRQGIWKN